MRLVAYGLTHPGNVRENNEDNYYLFGKYKKNIDELSCSDESSVQDDLALAAVFDGMGGEAAGEVASLIAAENIEPSHIETAELHAEKQLTDINNLVCREIIERNARVGTTAVMCYFDHEEMVSINLGDSRSYCYRDGKLTQISKDHSEGQVMVDMGLFTEEEAKKNKVWHKLTQHIGIFPNEFILEPYSSGRIKLKRGDIYLLCSDGLTDMLSNEQIEQIVGNGKHRKIAEIAKTLRDRALSEGGRDNITIIVIAVESDEKTNKIGNISSTGQIKSQIIKGLIIGIIVALFIGIAIQLIIYGIKREIEVEQGMIDKGETISFNGLDNKEDNSIYDEEIQFIDDN